MNDSNDYWHKINLSDDDSTDYVINPYTIPYNRYTNKEFLVDLAKEKKHWFIKILDIFLYGFMIIVDWLDKKLKGRGGSSCQYR